MLSKLRTVYLPFFHDVGSGSAIGSMLLNALRFVKSSRLDGDYLEFGVHKGRSFIAAHHFSKRYKLD